MDGEWTSRLSRPVRTPIRWALLEGNRLVVTGIMLIALYVLIAPVGHFALGLVDSGLTESRAISTLLSTLLSGVFLLVSIVVSINSLFVSQEQVPLGQQFERVQNAAQFRRELEDLVGVPVSPAEPDRFLQVLTGALLTRAQRLSDQLADGDPEIEADVQGYVAHAADETDALNTALQSARTPLSLVLVTLDYDHTRLTNGLRRIRSECESVPPDADETIDEMLTILDHLAAAREYFKTLYFGREFADLSNRLIFVSVPAIGIVSFALAHVTRLPDSPWVIAGLHVVALAPVALLATYVVRVATVSKRTRSTGQFIVGTHEDPPWDTPERNP